MSILDFSEEAEKQSQVVYILKKLHRTKLGKQLIHSEKCLTDPDGYEFPCPLCGIPTATTKTSLWSVQHDGFCTEGEKHE